MNLVKDALVTRVEASAAAGQGTLVSDILDMAGYDAVTFIAMLGDVDNTCALELHAKQNTVNSTSGAAQINGKVTATATTTSADDKLLILDVLKPLERYVYCELVRGTADAVVDGIIAIQYRTDKVPVTQGATVLGSNLTISPAEGTS